MNDERPAAAGEKGRAENVRLVVFAHTPPPHHGQSFMVELFLRQMGGDARFNRPSDLGLSCYHVNARFSRGIGDIGQMRSGKFWLALRYVLEAVWCRIRYGAGDLYYVPASPMRSAVYRDWLVLGLCRPFFRRLIYHWHAVGLGEWLENQARPWERGISRWLLGRPDLSIVLGEYNRRDAAQLSSQKVVVVANGIPDPCPEFERDVQPQRERRAERRQKLAVDGGEATWRDEEASVYRLLFIGLCSRDKGLFDLVEAVGLVTEQLRGSRFRVFLDVAGTFWVPEEQREFDQRVAELNRAQPCISYRGFVSGDEKRRLFVGADCLCFPTYYVAESFGLVLLEAMAFGLSIVATRWRTIPEVLPENYPALVEPRRPGQLAEAIIKLIHRPYDPGLRQRFLDGFTEGHFGQGISRAIRELH